MHVLYGSPKKSRTHIIRNFQKIPHIFNAVLTMQFAMQFRQCSFALSECDCSFDFSRKHLQFGFSWENFPGSFCNLSFPGRFSGGTFRFEFSWWDFPGRFSPTNFLVGFSGRKIAWTISTCKISCTKTWYENCGSNFYQAFLDLTFLFEHPGGEVRLQKRVCAN